MSFFTAKFSEISLMVIISSFLCSFFYQNSMVEAGVNLDTLSWSMVALTLLVCSITLSSSLSKKSMPPYIILSMLIAMAFFLTDNLFTFFIMFEMSLIPLMILVLSWGSNAERLNATQFMMVYTVIGSAPLLLSCLIMSMDSSSIFLSSLSEKEDVILSLGILAFFVKIPVFMFHSWLPKAHVEAPLEGSMILAGIMLKVGVYGLIRILSISTVNEGFLDLIFSLSLGGSIISSILALSSDDMKMSVAFSSVSHMNMVACALLSMKESGELSSTIIMISHGICSPLLFYLVTKIYSSSNSRSILISKGVYSNSPFLWLMGFTLWAMNLSIPPFFSFVGELMGFSAVCSVFGGGIVWVGAFLLSSSFFSIVNFGMQSHSSFKLPLKGSLGSKDYLFLLFTTMVGVISFLIFFFPL